MRSILFHTKEYGAKVTGLATRPSGIEPDPLNQEYQKCQDCISALITVEEGDTSSVVDDLFSEIKRMCEDTERNQVVLIPFAHLSNKLAKSNDAKLIFRELEKKVSNTFKVIKAHFGSDKELLLHIAGHPGNARYREF